ncbi:biopolymer transporter ExbD [Oceanicoccus sp. KOV_DT_Chl]|uniref:ExbD/TolR family protein n=1 Tax=Oceanicoccus sp. KOV_DT_Chl TaxID=1904639 RepID=UPI000C7D9279|nr:biopolymer transporter ExbD [Oceanicoccus sp. KOV_DT_Chl]
MIKSQSVTASPLLTAEITPLIDIVFIVIVFLLITANAPLLSLPVAVPESDAEVTLELTSGTELTVSITAEKPYWHIDQETYHHWRDFKQALLAKTQGSNQSLTIAADKAAPSEPLLKLLALLNQQAFGHAHIVLQHASTEE